MPRRLVFLHINWSSLQDLPLHLHQVYATFLWKYACINAGFLDFVAALFALFGRLLFGPYRNDDDEEDSHVLTALDVAFVSMCFLPLGFYVLGYYGTKNLNKRYFIASVASVLSLWLLKLAYSSVWLYRTTHKHSDADADETRKTHPFSGLCLFFVFLAGIMFFQFSVSIYSRHFDRNMADDADQE